MAKTQAVAKAAKLDLAVLASDSKDASGFGNLDMSRDIAIPYINILQSNSPQLNPQKAEYVDGAKIGQFYNTVTQEVSDSLNVIPVLYQLRYVEWKPREQGGGFVESHHADSGILSKTKRDQISFKDVLPNGNYVATTAYHYVMVQGKDGAWSQAVVSMTSTQLKKSRRWNSLMLSQKISGPSGSFTPPTYAIIYKLSTVVSLMIVVAGLGIKLRELVRLKTLACITRQNHFQLPHQEEKSKLNLCQRVSL